MCLIHAYDWKSYLHHLLSEVISYDYNVQYFDYAEIILPTVAEFLILCGSGSVYIYVYGMQLLDIHTAIIFAQLVGVPRDPPLIMTIIFSDEVLCIFWILMQLDYI